MADDPVTLAFEIEGLAPRLHVTRIDGREGLSELYGFEVTVACEDGALALEDLLGARARLALSSGRHTRRVHGIVGRVEQTEDVDDMTAYAVSLVPEVKRLELGENCRVFSETTVPQVIETVLRDGGVTRFRFALRAAYPSIDLAIQYRESDWAFISRLAEAEGIFYWFEQDDDGATVVFGDGLHANTPLEPETIAVRAVGGLEGGEHISRFRMAEELRPDRVAVRGQSFKHPALPLDAAVEAAGGAHIEVFDHFADRDPGSRPDPALAERRARHRLEQLQVDRVTARAVANTPRLAAGNVFTLAEHRRDAFNQRYLLTRVVHHASSPTLGAATATYSSEIACIPATVPFRPALATPHPRSGAQTAVVVGPKGEEIYTDELGRIRVQFHWDRRGSKDERSSCWIRVAQLWAGSGFGTMHIPRVGNEVLVDFLGGDVDRPIVIGGLYQATNVHPYVLPAAKTITTMKSRSTPGGDGSNELRFQDAKGDEEVYLHAERDLDVVVEQDRSASVGADDELVVGGERAKSVGLDEIETIGRAKTITVGGAHTETIGATQTITVAAGSAFEVGGDRSARVAGTATEVVGKGLTLTIGGAKSERVMQASAEAVGGDKTTTVEGNYLVTTGADAGFSIAGSANAEIEHEQTITVGERIRFACGAGRITVDKTGAILIEGTDIELRSARPLKLEGETLHIKSSGAVNVKADGAVKVRGGRVTMN